MNVWLYTTLLQISSKLAVKLINKSLGDFTAHQNENFGKKFTAILTKSFSKSHSAVSFANDTMIRSKFSAECLL